MNGEVAKSDIGGTATKGAELSYRGGNLEVGNAKLANVTVTENGRLRLSLGDATVTHGLDNTSNDLAMKSGAGVLRTGDSTNVYAYHDATPAPQVAEAHRFKVGDFAKADGTSSTPTRSMGNPFVPKVISGNHATEAPGGSVQELAQATTPAPAKAEGAASPAEPAKLAPAQQPTPAATQTPPAEQPPAMQRRIIRNGEMEFEVEGFDSAYMQIGKIVAEEGGFIATTDSQKLPNGKMKGTIVLRVAPERLDVLILKLRALGDLKNQKIAAQDITKQYTDLESALKAARAMETRLLEMIKSGQGQIKDLLAAEKELGIWREKIEQTEGEIRYYNSLISLSTLSVTLWEKDIKTPTYAAETEQRNIGIEAEDVEKAYAGAQTAIAEAKGRIVESELKKYEAGQLAAKLVCEVNPDNAGPLTDRLKQIGKMARLDIERKQTTQGGTGAPAGIKLDRKDTRFLISLYNLANVAPRQTTNLNLACRNVEEAYRQILARVEKAGGRVVSSNLNRPKAEQTTGTISFRGEER